MRFGMCMGVESPEYIKLIKESGYDYVECGFGGLSRADDAVFESFKAALIENGMKCEAANSFFPGDYPIINHNYKCKEYSDFINPESLVVVKNAKAEPALADAKAGETFQFVRFGYFCADNLPPAIIPTIAQFVSKTDNAQKIATVTDIRVGEKMFNEFPSVLKNLEEQGYKYKVLFVDASEEVLVRRYKETRRKHPLLDKCDGSLHAAIAMEHEKLLNIRMKADYIIDNNGSIDDLKNKLNNIIQFYKKYQ